MHPEAPYDRLSDRVEVPSTIETGEPLPLCNFCHQPIDDCQCVCPYCGGIADCDCCIGYDKATGG